MNNDPSWSEWASTSWIKNASASGLSYYLPNNAGACTGLGGAYVGTLYGISSGGACAIARLYYNARKIKCAAAEKSIALVPSFEGYAVRSEGFGLFFERGAQYFTYVPVC
jgi:hypothetical protein